jgi:hypothetical protein
MHFFLISFMNYSRPKYVGNNLHLYMVKFNNAIYSKKNGGACKTFFN